jgi:hypothetical protein
MMTSKQRSQTTTTTSPVVTWLVPGLLLSITVLFALQVVRVEQGNWQATTGMLQNLGITGALLVLTAASSLNARRAQNELS